MAGQQGRLWLGSAAPQPGQCLLLFDYSLPSERDKRQPGARGWVTQAGHGHQQRTTLLSHLLLFAFPLKTFLVVESPTGSRAGAQGEQSPLGTGPSLLFSLPPRACRGWGAVPALLSLPTRTGRAGAAGRDSSHRVLPAGRARGLIKVRGCCQQRERGSGG